MATEEVGCGLEQAGRQAGGWRRASKLRLSPDKEFFLMGADSVLGSGCDLNIDGLVH